MEGARVGYMGLSELVEVAQGVVEVVAAITAQGNCREVVEFGLRAAHWRAKSDAV